MDFYLALTLVLIRLRIFQIRSTWIEVFKILYAQFITKKLMPSQEIMITQPAGLARIYDETLYLKHSLLLNLKLLEILSK